MRGLWLASFACLSLALPARAQAPADLDEQHAAPPSAEPAAQTSPQADAPPTPQPAAAVPDSKDAPVAAAASPAPPAPKVVGWVGQSFTVPNMTLVLASPTPDTPVTSKLRAGASVEVIGILDDPSWLQVRLPDQTIGYVRAENIPAVSSPQNTVHADTPLPAKPAVTEAANVAKPTPSDEAGAPGTTAQPIVGLATIHDTSALVLRPESGAADPTVVAVVLVGVDGFGGEPARGMEEYLESNGSWVTCVPAEKARAICKLRDGTDLAKAALVNGAARVTAGAPADYVLQEDNAKKSRRGIWRDGTDDVAAIPIAADEVPLQPGQYVPGVDFAPGGGIPPVFTEARQEQGLAFIEDQPFTLVDGEPAPIEYDPGFGWGFWDRSFKWRRAPGAWMARLNGAHLRGAGLREVDLARHGFTFHDSYFRGPAVHASFAPGRAPLEFGRTPYAAAAFTLHAPPLVARQPGLQPMGGQVRRGPAEFATAAPRPMTGLPPAERAALAEREGRPTMPISAPHGPPRFEPRPDPMMEARPGGVRPGMVPINQPAGLPARAAATPVFNPAFAAHPMPPQAPVLMGRSVGIGQPIRMPAQVMARPVMVAPAVRVASPPPRPAPAVKTR